MYPDYQLVAWSLSIPNGITVRDTRNSVSFSLIISTLRFSTSGYL